jgi:hypothetical protein
MLQSETLLDSEPALFRRFGRDVATKGDLVAVIGVESSGDSLAAAVFRRDGPAWLPEPILLDQHVYEFTSIAVEGDVLVAGVTGPSSPDLAGGAYVFRYNNGAWRQEALLTVPGLHSYNEFGTAVDVEGDVIVVGAPRDSGCDGCQDPETGSVYVFQYEQGTWMQQTRLRPQTTEIAEFGGSLSLRQGRLLVGARLDRSPCGDDECRTGAAYLFDRVADQWLPAGRLVPDDPEAATYFGTDVALRGDRALIGASGAAYFFTLQAGSWVQEQKLVSPAPGAAGDFGAAVGLGDEMAIIGAPGADDGCPDDQPNCNIGAAYLFAHSAGAWTLAAQPRRVQASDENLHPRGRFGVAVAFDDVLVIGAPEDHVQPAPNDFIEPVAGAAYVFEGLEDCDADGTLDGCQIAADPALDRDASGAPDACEISRGDAPDADGDGVIDGCIYTGACIAAEQAAIEIPVVSGLGEVRPVAMSGTLAAVASPDLDSAVYIHRRTPAGWVPEAELRMDVAVRQFGRGVAASGDRIAVSGELGFVHIFRRSEGTWSREITLTPPAGMYFLRAIDISGDRLLVAATPVDDFEFGAQLAILYHFDGGAWTLEAELFPPDPQRYHSFGSAVALDGGMAAVAALGDTNRLIWPYEGGVDLSGVGAVYTYRLAAGSWSFQEKLTPPGGHDHDAFGSSLDLQANRLLIGSPGEDRRARDSGAAYVFEWDGAAWQQDQRLVPSDQFARYRFGSAVALDGDSALVSTLRSADTPGTVSVFIRHDGLWTEQAKLALQAPSLFDGFGATLAAADGWAIAGTSRTETSGAVVDGGYLFDGIADNDGNGIPDACDCPADLDANARADVFDLLTYLDAWFALAPDAEWTGDSPASIDLLDLLAYLDVWFAGC